MNELQDSIERANKTMVKNLSLVGITKGLILSPNNPVDMSVHYSNGGAYDADGHQIDVPLGGSIDLSPYAVVNAGNERWVTIIATFIRKEYDEREDGNKTRILYHSDEFYAISVLPGVEGLLNATARPETNGIILGDIRLIYGQSQVTEDDIDFTRRNDTPRMIDIYVQLMFMQEMIRAEIQSVNMEIGNADRWGIPDWEKGPVRPTEPESMSVICQDGYGRDGLSQIVQLDSEVTLDLSPYAVTTEGNSRWLVIAISHVELQEPPIIMDGDEAIYYYIRDSAEVIVIPGEEVPSDSINGTPVPSRGEDDYSVRLKKIRLDYGMAAITSDNIFGFGMYED